MRSILPCLLLSLTLLGCEGGSSSPTTEKTTAKALLSGLTSVTVIRDPHRAQEAARRVLLDLYEGLTIQDPWGRPIAGVAESWTSAAQNTEWTFTLRGDARWSNGDPVTAEDFVYSWQRAASAQTDSPYAWLVDLAGLAEVSALNAYTLQIRLTEPTPHLPQLLTHPVFMPVYRASVEAHGDDAFQPPHLVTNGAYQLESISGDDEQELVANPLYWDHDNTAIERVRYRHHDSANAAVDAFRAGELHLTSGFASDMLESLRGEFPEQLVFLDEFGTYYYSFNLSRPPLDDVRIRQALTMAVDRRVLTAAVLDGLQTPALRLTPDSLANFTPAPPEWRDWVQGKREGVARDLLAEAGYSADRPLRLELLHSDIGANGEVAQQVAALWRAALDPIPGDDRSAIEVTLRQESGGDFDTAVAGGDFTIVNRGWLGDYNAPLTFLELGMSGNEYNVGGYSDPQFDELLNRARRSEDPAEQRQLFEEADARLLEAQPYLPLFHYRQAQLLSPVIAGVAISNPEQMIYSKDVYWREP